MVFNPNIPQASDFVSITQKQALTNYSQMYIQFGFDHVTFDAATDTDRGKHKKLTFPEQSGDPTTAANDYTWYTKNDSGAPELYARGESNGTVVKWTKGARVSPSLRLEAYVLFDLEGNILKNKDNEELKYNITSVVPASPLFNGKNVRDDWIVTFENNITTDKFFWVITPFYRAFTESFNFEDSAFDVTVPYMFGTYANAITNQMIRIMTKTVSGLSTAAQRHTGLVHLQVYTLA